MVKLETQSVFGPFKSSEGWAIDLEDFFMSADGVFCYDNFDRRLLRAFLVETASSLLLTKT